MHTTPDLQTNDVSPSAVTSTVWGWLALLVACVLLLGSLWLSVGLKLKACPLCLYQRTLVMGVVAVLGVGLLTGKTHTRIVSLLALPLAVAGLGVAAFHEYLEATGTLECPDGIMGLGTAPQQSLAGLVVLLILVGLGVGAGVRGGGYRWSAVAGAGVLGVLFAGAAVLSAPPMPEAPTKPYATPLEVCRPPYRL